MDDGEVGTTRRRWAEEDTTPTSQREVYGFYSYGIAAEVFAVVGVGAFLPVTLEQLARENGVLYSDRSVACKHAPPARLAMRAEDRDPEQCVVKVFGSSVTTASFAMYTFSLAVLCQAIMLISFSSFADYGRNRKMLLMIFGIVGAMTSVSFIFIVPQLYLIASLLVIVSVTCMGSSFVTLNSFLPLLASHHPDVLVASKRTGMMRVGNATELKISEGISARAVALGYAAAVFVQCLSIGLLAFVAKVLQPSDETLGLRLTLVLAGIWWLVFMSPAYLWLRPRPGPPLPSGTSKRSTVQTRMFDHVQHAWKSLYRTIRAAFKMRQMTRFLIAWFLLSDAIASVSGTAVLFARTELHIGTIGIALLSITAIGSGVVGAIFWPWISTRGRLHWSSNHTIVYCICLMETIPIYGLLPYLPFVRAWGVGGLQQAWEIYPLAFIHGIVMGGLSSYCRSFFGQLIPPGHEAAFYALFAITDKGSSAIGPAVVGRIVDATGHIRPAFWFLLVLIALPGPLIWLTDLEAGRTDAKIIGDHLDQERDNDVSLEMRDRHDEEEEVGLMHEARAQAENVPSMSTEEQHEPT